jgi:hypothetical protein
MVLSAEPAIVVPISSATALSPWGIPTVVPEILLFYKGTAYFGDVEMTKRRSHDDVDFETLATGSIATSARGYETRSRASIPTTRGWNGCRTGTSLRPRSGYRDRLPRPSDAAGGA